MQRFMIIVPNLLVVAVFCWLLNSYEPTPNQRMMLGAQLKKAAWVDEALAAGAHVDLRDDCGLTPLMWAVSNGDQQMLHRLLAAGADPSLRTGQGLDALGWAAMCGNTGAITVLLGAGVGVDGPQYQECTAMHLAAMMLDLQTAQVLAAGGADVNARDAQGMTPLMFAAEQGGESLPMLQWLVAAGADLQVRDSANLTALSHALQERNTDGATMLRNAVANASSAPRRDLTADAGFAPPRVPSLAP